MAKTYPKPLPKRLQNPASNPGVYRSICCGSEMSVVPASLGDPEIWICDECQIVGALKLYVPFYEKVSPGTYRKINYLGTDMLQLMDWKKMRGNAIDFNKDLYLGEFPDSEEKPKIAIGSLQTIDSEGMHFKGIKDMVPNCWCSLETPLLNKDKMS